MIKQIKFVSIPVADQNRALDFYTDKLGFTIITDQPFDEKQRWIELRIPKAETRLVLFTPEGEEKRSGSFMNMSYACDDIDKTYEELKKRGVEFEGPPQKQPWGTYAMFKDSEGNRFVVSVVDKRGKTVRSSLELVPGVIVDAEIAGLLRTAIEREGILQRNFIGTDVVAERDSIVN